MSLMALLETRGKPSVPVISIIWHGETSSDSLEIWNPTKSEITNLLEDLALINKEMS